MSGTGFQPVQNFGQAVSLSHGLVEAAASGCYTEQLQANRFTFGGSRGEFLASENPQDSFRVIDRRLFTEDGELRKGALDEERAEQEAARKSPAPATPVPQTGTGEAKPAAAPAEAPRPSPQFQMLVDLLARNAALFLGGYADPATGQPVVDLEGAREMIDMMEVLREKTRGNLAAQEERLLTDVLGSLKMSYLEISKAAAQAMRQDAATQPVSKSRHKS